MFKYLLGHACTIPGPSGEDIDIGFMVMNELTYPNLIRLFKDIGVETEESDMSFSVFEKAGTSPFSWSFQSTYAWMARNLFRPRLWKVPDLPLNKSNKLNNPAFIRPNYSLSLSVFARLSLMQPSHPDAAFDIIFRLSCVP